MKRNPTGSWRRIIGVLAIAVVAWLVLWACAGALAPRALDSAIPQLIAHAAPLGVEITEVSVPAVRIAPTLSGVTIDGLRARFDLDPGNDEQLGSRIAVDELEVRLRNPLTLRGSVRANGVEIALDASDLPASLPFDRFTNGTIVIMDLPLTRPAQAVREIREGLEQLFAMNEVTGAALFEGDVKIPFDDGAMVAHLYTERDGDRFRLRFRESEIQAISERKQLDLAPEQVALVALYPLRVPALMIITEQARSLSLRHEPRDVWLRDASRHVLWSYLLTERFGADFAQEVTDAQETREGNTPAERAMDFHNNAIGRRYFEQSVAFAELPRRVREDPDVIRHPDEVAALGAQRLLR